MTAVAEGSEHREQQSGVVALAFAVYHYELAVLMEPGDPPDWDLVPHRPAWQRRAACRGLGFDHFIIDRSPDAARRVREALEVCRTCPVTEQCLAYALDNDFPGVWGGTTPSVRRRMRQLSS